MTERQQSLYRYLTQWCDFTHAEAMAYIFGDAADQRMVA